MKSTAVAFLVVLVAAAAARADTITVTADYTSVYPGLNGRIYDIPHFPNGVSTRAGVFNFTVTAAAPGSGLVAGQTLKAFDLEMQYINAGNNVYTVVDLEDAPNGASPGPNPGDTMGTLRANLLRNLWFQHDSVIDSGTAVEAAAFQLAVWAIVYDPIGDINVLGAHTAAYPGFWTTDFDTNATTMANDWLAALDPDGDKVMTLLALVDPESQDFMFLGPLSPQGFVPLPGSLWMGLALMSGLAAVRVRRRRHAA